MAHARIRRALLATAAAGVVIAGVGPAVEAANPCYPSKCKGGDARLGSISHQNPMQVTRTSFATLNGRNVGTKATDVVGKLRFSHGRTEPHVSPRVHVGKNQPFSIYFRVTPTSAGRARLRGCVEARPEDVNPTNNCGSSRVQVRRPG